LAPPALADSQPQQRIAKFAPSSPRTQNQTVPHQCILDQALGSNFLQNQSGTPQSRVDGAPDFLPAHSEESSSASRGQINGDKIAAAKDFSQTGAPAATMPAALMRRTATCASDSLTGGIAFEGHNVVWQTGDARQDVMTEEEQYSPMYALLTGCQLNLQKAPTAHQNGQRADFGKSCKRGTKVSAKRNIASEPSPGGDSSFHHHIAIAASREIQNISQAHEHMISDTPAQNPESDVTIITSNATTMMICNIPCRLPYDCLVDAIHSIGFAGTYEFVHVPHRYGQKEANLGYAFVNFTSSEVAARFAVSFEGHRFRETRSTKSCTVKVAERQQYNGIPAQTRSRRQTP
jgi:hypothetical protein